MPIKLHQKDILPHLGTDASLSSQVASIQGCITIISIGVASLKGCYSISGDNVKVSAVLSTPLGDIDLGSAIIDINHPSFTLSGGIDGFKAEVTFSFNFDKMILTICGKICAPFTGCLEGCTDIHF